MRFTGALRACAAAVTIMLLLWIDATPAPAARPSFFGSAKCGVLWDKWEAPGAPAGALATAGMAHETVAARDCIVKENFAQACEHYHRALSALDKLDADAAVEIEPDVRAQMEKINCR